MLFIYILSAVVGAILALFFQENALLPIMIGGSIGGGLAVLFVAVYHGIREK